MAGNLEEEWFAGARSEKENTQAAAEEKENPASEDEEEPGAAENPPPTNRKYDRIAPYLRKWDPEKPEEIDEAIYYFTDEDVEDEIPPGKLDRMRNSIERYFKQVQESGGKGYDVDCIPPSCVGSPFIPRTNRSTIEHSELPNSQLTASILRQSPSLKISLPPFRFEVPESLFWLFQFEVPIS